MIRYIVLGLGLLAGGCGGGAIDAHARAAYATQEVLTGAHASILEARRVEGERVIDAAPDQASARDGRDQVDVRFEPIVDVYETLRAALDVWIRIVLRAAAGEDLDVEGALGAAGDVVRLWVELARAAAHVGVRLPDLPTIVNAITGAAEEES